MKKITFLLTLLLSLFLSTGAWAESKLSKAVAGTYLFDSSNPALTVNAGGATITSDNGAIIIHHDNLSIVTSSRTYATVVMRVDMPTTAPGSFSKFISLKPSNNFSGSIGLGVTTGGKLKGTWEGNEWSGNGGGVVTTSAVTGEHTIVLLCNDGGTTIYVDGTSTSVNNNKLKGGTKWTDLRIESDYVSCVKSVYVLSGDQASNISDFFSELSNVVTVADEETKSVSDNSKATRFFVASGGTLTADVDYDADKIEVAGNVEIASEKTLNVNAAWFDLTKITGEGNVTLDADATISGSKSTVATGKLTINEGKTLTLGTDQGQTNSIESFTSIELAGTIKHNNSVATFNSVTVPTGKTGKIFAYDMGATSDGFKLAGTTTLVGDLVVCSKYNFQMKVDVLAGSGGCLICGTTGDNYDASGTSSSEAATINIASASSYTGNVTVNNSKATVNLAGSLVASSWTKTNGTLNYAGNNLNGTTLDGVVLNSTTARITTSNTVNIKNLAGCNLPNPGGNYGYVFIGSGGTINLYGTCDFTKKADGTTALSSNLGYTSSASIVIKENATVTAGVVFNTNGTNNASITVESGATLNTIGWTHADDVLYAYNLTNNGTINLSTGQYHPGYGISKIHSTLSGSGALNIAEGANLEVSSVPSTMTLTGAGNVVLTSFPTSTAPTLSAWTGAVEFPNGGSSSTNLEAIFNAWGNTNSTIKLNNVSGGYLGNGGTVNPTLNILSGKTLTLNNGFSSSNSTLTKVTGAGTLDRQGWSNSNNHNLYITTLTGFTGTLSGTGHPIIVQKLVLSSAPYADALLIKTSGTVTLNSLSIELEPTTAYTWETKTVEDIEGIYVTEIDQVQLYREMAAATVSPYFTYIGTGVGKYTISLSSNEKYTSIPDFNEALLAWSELSDCSTPIVTINQPTSAFYRFKAAGRSASDDTHNWYMGGNADGIYSASTTAAQASDANTIFYLEKDGDGYHPLSYVTGLYSSGIANNAVGTKSNFTLTQAIKANNTDLLYGEYKLVNTGTSKTIVMWSNATLNAIDGNNDWSGWIIEEVTSLPVTISTAKFATLYSPVALSIPEGVTAYVATEEGDSYIHFDEIEDGIVPANTGVLLYADVNVATTYDFEITTGGTAVSELTGTVTAITRPDYSYILATGTSGLAFYMDGATTIPGFKAYFQDTTGGVSGVRTFHFGDLTAVKAIEAAQNPGKVVYDMNGRRVENPAKGLYIVNGKKVFINKK
jgi:hypothetical protein